MKKKIIILFISFSLYSATCAELWDVWDPNDPENCLACVQNASKINQGKVSKICQCNPGYWGSSWQFRCSLLCYECEGGSSSTDWISCTENAQLVLSNRGQLCFCKSGWSGANCSHWDSTSQNCHPLCKDDKCTSGPTADKWLDCVAHASRKSGFCTWDQGWEGEKWNIKLIDDFRNNHISHNEQSGYKTIKSRLYATTNEGNTVNTDLALYGSVNQSFDSDQHRSKPTRYSQWNYGYSGEDCTHKILDFNCSPICQEGWTGPFATDCTDCAIHAYRDYLNDCTCELHWQGDDCSIYHGPCDSKCYGCNGPSASECRYCVPHANLNRENMCECEHDWEGEDCSLWNGACDIKCAYNECVGPTSFDCTVCIDHASWDINALCVCDEYWTGYDCSVYKGTCDERCLGCYGSSNSHCSYCVPHTKLVDSAWVCQPGWTGSDCGSFEGTCHARCLSGTSCLGESSSDCNYCNQNATLDSYRNWVCKFDWTGDDCGTYIGRCHPKCVQCTGPLSADWQVCVVNAHLNEQGFCLCDLDWDEDDCSMWKGAWHPMCGDCHGPESCDCDRCTLHAHWKSPSIWECDPNWSGSDCRTFIGACHPKWDEDSGCTGITDEHCNLCAFHAHRDPDGSCTCDAHWAGMDCSIYLGECHPLWIGCTGPNDWDCKKCLDHATMDKNNAGTCYCFEDWTGTSCETYTGACSPKCSSTCTGPTAYNCKECAVHAEFDPANNMTCVCKDEWGMDDCSVYIGMCHKLWDGCTGPESSDCKNCTANAHKNVKNMCACDQYFTGGDCSKYTGKWDPRCAGGCYGPEVSQCIRCVEHAERIDLGDDSDIGTCQWVHNWSGDDCTTYIGKWHPSCMVTPTGLGVGPIDCFNENPEGCNQWVMHAYRDSAGAWEWFDDWEMIEYGDQMAFQNPNRIWECGEEGEQHLLNLTMDQDYQYYKGCKSSNPTNCRGAFEWDLSDPQQFWKSGDTATHFVEITWTIPMYLVGIEVKTRTQGEITELNVIFDDGCAQHIKLFPSAHSRSITQVLGFEIDWPSTSVRIEIINGNPGAAGWWDPAFRIYGIACHIKNTQTYGNSNCDTYTGACHPSCSLCTGPDANNCMSCRDNADFRHDPEGPGGYCECYTDYAGPTWEEYKGPCDRHCLSWWGPEQNQCIEWVKNAYQGLESTWTCQWIPDYDDNTSTGVWTESSWTCVNYNQDLWDNPCSQCTSPSPEQCIECHPHAYRNELGFCSWHPDWMSTDCATYQGPCDKRCNACTGPFNEEWQECSGNAYEIDGKCVCKENFTGYNCVLWQGECNPICKGCFNRRGITSNDASEPTDCFECVKNAHWEHVIGSYPRCVCDHSWTGDDCSIYNENDCYHTCGLCRGPLQKDCISCVNNAHRDHMGLWVCNPGWETEGCATWAGLCDHRCIGCTGSTNEHCVACVANAAWSEDTQTCECLTDWRGPNWQRYSGKWHANCQSCHGPTSTDWEYCKTHAYKNHNGECVCEETWGPAEGCFKAINPCGEYWVNCAWNPTDGYNGTALCLECVSGLWATAEGNCEIWPDQCSDCDIDTQWTDCHDGFYLTDDGQCQPCNSNCKTCSGPEMIDCSACDAEKLLANAGPSYCVCESGVIHPFTLKCEERCPLTIGVELGMCTVTEPQVEVKFENIDSEDSTRWESGRYPTLHSDRGAYFNGIQWIEWVEFVPHAELFMEFWNRPDGGNNGVLMHFDFLSYPIGWGNDDCNASPRNDDFAWVFDSWYSYQDPVPYAIGWHSVAIAFSIQNSTTLEQKVKIDGNEIINKNHSDDSFIMGPILDNSNSFWWGSYRGSSYNNFQGFIYGFKYSAWQVDIYDSACSVNEHNYWQPVMAGENVNLVSCGPNEYYNDDVGCWPCHETCSSCNDDTPCSVPCHEDCLTCSGPSSDQCLTCHPGAHRTSPDSSQSCCSCDEDRSGSPSNCQFVCYDNSCLYCIGPYPHDWLVCEENYELVYTEDEDAHFWEYCFDNDLKYSVCGPRDITGLRIAEFGSELLLSDSTWSCQIGEWLHDGKCVRCPTGCTECKQSLFHWRAECLTCEQGYVRHSDMCITECPTGFHANTWQDSTLCTKISDSPIYSFTMSIDTHGFWERNMKYSQQHFIDLLELGLTYDVKLFGGASESALERDDPWPIDDRGYYFNGCDQFLTFNTEFIWTRTSVTQYWVKTHADGTLISNSGLRDDKFGKIYFSEFIQNGKYGYINSLEKQYMFHNSPATFFDWQSVAFEVRVGDSSQNAAGMHVHLNGVETDQVSMCEYPVGIGHQSHFGVLADNALMTDFFKGFLWKIASDSSLISDWMTPGEIWNGVWDQCPSDNGDGPGCLGICDMDFYWSQGKCALCPNWCREGCQSDGGC